MTPAQRVARIKAEVVGRDLSSWERFDFLPSIEQRTTLTPKQEECLRKIETRVFDEQEED